MKNAVLILCVLCSVQLFSQNVGIGTNSPLSKLHVAGTIRSDTLIYLGPGVRSLFATPDGRIYDSLVVPSTLNWEITGNANITAARFLGTTNANDVIFKTNNIERARILATGFVGIGTTAPREVLEISNSPASTGHNLSLSTQSEIPYWSLMKRPSTYPNPNNFHIAYFDGVGWNQYFDIMPNGHVGIGNTMPDASAQVEIASTTAGFAMPRMTSAQRKAITLPLAGLQVYDTDLKGFYVYDGIKWDCANNPAGTVQYFANTTAPNGYLECNGQAVSRVAYAELFNAIGTLYGVGDGVTTFNVPDLRGEFIRGTDNGKGADPGRTIGTTQAPSPVVHDDTAGSGPQNGDFSMDNAAAAYCDPWPGTLAGGIPSAYWAASPASWNVYAGTSTGGQAYAMIHASRPRNVALMPCIKF